MAALITLLHMATQNSRATDLDGYQPRGRMGRLRQAAFRRPRASLGLRWPLYPPGGHFQSPALGHRGGQGHLPLQGLSPRGPAENDDTASRRVYPPLPVARAARRLPAHPLLRLPGQPIPGTEISTLPRTLGHANARTTSLGNRQGLS